MIEVNFTPRFPRSLKKCSPEVIALFDDCLALFLGDPHDSRLHTKPLTGELRGVWSFRVGRSHRVLYQRISSTSFLFIDIDDRKSIYD